MRNDFCAFILSNRRADTVLTYRAVRRCGYRGKVFVVIDDEDPTADDYFAKFGDDVLVFPKSEIEKTFDLADNFTNQKGSIIHARNACFHLAREQGYRYFIELDDDYNGFWTRFDANHYHGSWRIPDLDLVWSEMVEFLETTPAICVAMGQGGDYVGGAEGTLMKSIMSKRKAMNTLICDVEKPFTFVGRINEDVNTYVRAGIKGELMLSVLNVHVTQRQTQAASGGMTEIYQDGGTYIKSFYTVMMCPSCVKISDFGSSQRRIHHLIDWEKAAVKIVSDQHRKPD